MSLGKLLSVDTKKPSHAVTVFWEIENGGERGVRTGLKIKHTICTPKSYEIISKIRYSKSDTHSCYGLSSAIRGHQKMAETPSRNQNRHSRHHNESGVKQLDLHITIFHFHTIYLNYIYNENTTRSIRLPCQPYEKV